MFARLVEPDRLPIRSGVSWRRYAIVSVILIVLVIVLRPVFAVVGDLLSSQSAGLATVSDSGTAGVHWSDAMSMAGSEADQPDISAAVMDRLPIGLTVRAKLPQNFLASAGQSWLRIAQQRQYCLVWERSGEQRRPFHRSSNLV